VRFGSSESSCRSCAQIYPASDLDRYLWCPSCRNKVRRRGAVWARLVGITASLGLAGYLYLWVHPSSRFLLFYFLTLAMTYLLTSRIAMFVVQGYYRARGGVALPPTDGAAR